jgi:hypothetical protein
LLEQERRVDLKQGVVESRENEVVEGECFEVERHEVE